MKKHILSMILVLCLVLSLVACGADDAAKQEDAAPSQSATTSETTETETETEPSETASEPAETTSDNNSALPTLEEYFEMDEMQDVLADVQEIYAEQGITASMYAEGDELHYDFKMDNLSTTEEPRAMMAESLKSTTDASAETYTSVLESTKAFISNEKLVIVVTFYDADGNEMFTQSFSSEDAQ